MYKWCLIFLFGMPVFCFSQEILTSKIDGFTNELTVETSLVTLKQGVSTGFGASYTAQNRNYYLNIIGYGKTGTIITDEDQVWLGLEDGTLIKLKHRAPVAFNETEYQNIYVHHYHITLEEVERLKYKKVVSIRIASANGNTDIPLSKKSSKNFLKLSNLFLTEVSK